MSEFKSYSPHPLLDALYDSGGTRRYHNRPKLEQNVKEHSWGVAVIITALHPNPSSELLQAAILHDAPEKVYGDILGPMKYTFPEAKALDEKCSDLFWKNISEKYDFYWPYLTEEDKDWLDFADVYERCLFSAGQNEEVWIDSFDRANELWKKIQNHNKD